MKSHETTPRLRACFLFLIFLATVCSPAVSSESPWVLLEKLRNRLQEGGPITSTFVQTYIPAGFSTGDQETGHLSIWLPDCLRWNYTDPEVKNFLLCNNQVYFWTENEEGGRRYRVDPQEEPGLDLLLLDVEALRERYVASTETLDDGNFRISLDLPSDAEERFTADIVIAPSIRRVLELSYSDNEGNKTLFALKDFQDLRHGGLFQAPKDIEWTDE